MEYLETIRSSSPEFTDDVSQLAHLYAHKLWHQLTVKLESLAANPAFFSAVNLVDLYSFFVKDFEKKLNPSRLVRFLFRAVEQPQESEKVIRFLQNVAAELKDPDATVCLEVKIEEFKMASGDLTTVKTTLEKHRPRVESGALVDTFALSVFHLASSKYFKATKNAEDYYKHAIAFLSYTTIDDMSIAEQIAFAYDIGLAAILGENIFNFGELLQHPIIRSLENSEHDWLFRLLKVFNIGDIAGFELLEKKQVREFTHPKIFQGKTNWLREKIRVCSLMELVFMKPSDNRVISFTEISEKTKTQHSEVELLVIKALSLGLVKGLMDEIDQVFKATWVRPRVLDIEQIRGLKDRLGDWEKKVDKTTTYLEGEIADSFVS